MCIVHVSVISKIVVCCEWNFHCSLWRILQRSDMNDLQISMYLTQGNSLRDIDNSLGARYKELRVLWTTRVKGQMKSECFYELIFQNTTKIFDRFLPWKFIKTYLSRAALRIIKTNHIYLVYKTFYSDKSIKSTVLMPFRQY